MECVTVLSPCDVAIKKRTVQDDQHANEVSFTKEHIVGEIVQLAQARRISLALQVHECDCQCR